MYCAREGVCRKRKLTSTYLGGDSGCYEEGSAWREHLRDRNSSVSAAPGSGTGGLWGYSSGFNDTEALTGHEVCLLSSKNV